MTCIDTDTPAAPASAGAASRTVPCMNEDEEVAWAHLHLAFMAFQTATGADGASVVVCTHNDADHANGILGFLEAGLRCGEVWLPGRWLEALPSVLRPLVEVFVDVADNVFQVAMSSSRQEGISGISSIEAYAERLGETSYEGSANQTEPSVGEDEWPQSYVDILERKRSGSNGLARGYRQE